MFGERTEHYRNGISNSPVLFEKSGEYEKWFESFLLFKMLYKICYDSDF